VDFNDIAGLLNGATNDKHCGNPGCGPSFGFGSSWFIWIIVFILLFCCNGNGFGGFGNSCGNSCGGGYDYECRCRRKRRKRRHCDDYCDDNDCCCDWSFIIILILILCCCCNKQQPVCGPVRETRSSSNIINVDSNEEE